MDMLDCLEGAKLPPELDIVEEELARFNRDHTYYLAGPMSGYADYNFRSFEAACRILRHNEIKVASPHEIDHGEEPNKRGSLPYETYMQAGLKLLRNCDGIILLNGWPQSTGAMRELQLAIERGMRVYFFHWPQDWKDSAELLSMNRRPR